MGSSGTEFGCLISLYQDLALCSAANPLVAALGAFTPSLTLLEVSLIHETASTLFATANPLAADLLARALTLLKLKIKIHGSLVVALLAGADPLTTDLLAGALSLLEEGIVSLEEGGLVTFAGALGTNADPFIADFLA
jgi:hypothetical protein